MGWSISDNQPEFVAFWKETWWGGVGGDWKPLSFCSGLYKAGTFQRQCPLASFGASFHFCNGKRCPQVRGPQCLLLRVAGHLGASRVTHLTGLQLIGWNSGRVGVGGDWNAFLALNPFQTGFLSLRTPQMVNVLSKYVCLMGSFTNSTWSRFIASVPDQVVVV